MKDINSFFGKINLIQILQEMIKDISPFANRIKPMAFTELNEAIVYGN